MKKHFVILGNSAAAISAVQAIRQTDDESLITLVSSEPVLAYSPVLTTYLIARRIGKNEMHFIDPDFYEKHQVVPMLGISATRIDPLAKEVFLDTGDVITYDKLLIATGSSPKKMGVPGDDLPGVFYLKTLYDAENILKYSEKAEEAVVIGGGLIGLQAANGLHINDRRVTMLVGSKQLLSRNVDGQCGNMLAQRIMEDGVQIRFGTDAISIEQKDGRLMLNLTNGNSMMTDMVVVGKGVQANMDMVKGTGIDVNQAILVNEKAETSIPDIYAAGDVTEGPCVLDGKHAVLASWLNACRQGYTAGSNMVGRESTYFNLGENITTVFDTTVAVIGISKAKNKSHREYVACNKKKNTYRKVVCNEKDELIGAVMLNDIDDAGLLSTAIQKRQVIDKALAEEIVNRAYPFAGY